MAAEEGSTSTQGGSGIDSEAHSADRFPSDVGIVLQASHREQAIT